MCLLVLLSLLRSFSLKCSKSYRKHNSFSAFSIATKHKVHTAENKKKISEKFNIF